MAGALDFEIGCLGSNPLIVVSFILFRLCLRLSFSDDDNINLIDYRCAIKKSA